jgi:8-oxoguanine deaminase
MDLGEDQGKSTPRRMVERDEAIIEDMERVISAFHQTGHGATRQVALAPTAAAIVSDELMRGAAALAEAHDCRLHTHLGEAADEVPWCRDTYGYGLVDWLAERNWLGPRTWLAHGIHFTPEEAHRLGLHGVGICHCPTSNALLASGRCRTREIEAAGSPLGLGSDGGASAGAANMLEEIRHAIMGSRLTYGDAAGTTHLDVLRWATEGSARCLGRTDIGKIEVGRCADFALFKMDELRLSGAHDPIAAIALVGATRADRVMVGGTWTVVDGAPVGVDTGALIARHTLQARRLAQVAA